MSTNIANDTAKIRANAASSVIQNEFIFIDTKRQFDNFKIESTSVQNLSDREFRKLMGFKDMTAKLLQQIKLSLTLSSSAILTSLSEAGSANKINAIVNQIDNASKNTTVASLKLSEFNTSGNPTIQKKLLEEVQDSIRKALDEIKSIIDQLVQLLFG